MNTPIIFSFEELAVRILPDENNEPWFNANDVCTILGYSNPRKAVADHCKEEGVTKRDTIDNMGRKQEASFINEGNLYRLMVKSRKPEAERFERWKVKTRSAHTGRFFLHFLPPNR